jgi:ABC-2 type transport system permease protein
LPFIGSAFVPTDSMPAWLRWFAQYQPFTPMIETRRGTADGHPDRQQRHSRGALVLRALADFVWSRAVFIRQPDR